MKKLCVLLFLLTLIVSCKKSSNNNSSCTTSMASIAGVYEMTGYTYKPDASSPAQDYYSMVPACIRDDITTFNVNGNYTYTDAGSVCSPAGDYSGTWSVSGSSINVDGTLFTIAAYDCHVLTIATSNATTGEEAKMTYTRQ